MTALTSTVEIQQTSAGSFPMTRHLADTRAGIEEAEGREWPAVEAAYGFVLPSYQMLATRFEAADSRLTTLMTLASTLAMAAPVFGRTVNPNISLSSPWFLMGMLLFFAGVALGLVGRFKGKLTLPNPRVHYIKNLGDSDWAFKKNAIYFAGQHFDANAKSIRVKGNISLWLTAAFVLQVLAFVAWVSGRLG